VAAVYRIPPATRLPPRVVIAPFLLNPQFMRPNGAGATAWTASAGSNYDCVNETTPDDADYVYATAAGLLDSYEVPTYDDPQTDDGFIVRFRVKLATGAASVQVRLYEGTTLRSTGPTVDAAGDYVWNVPAADIANITDRAAVRVAVYSSGG
jgi:hypothetical protein